LWKSFADWASFQARRARPKKVPGKVFYQDGFSHVFEKYRDYLLNLNDHPDFASESQYCQEQMTRFSDHLAHMDLSDFAASPTAEAKKSDKTTKMQQSLDCARYRTVSTSGGSTGVVVLQDQVAPRLAEFGQCSDSVWMGSTTSLPPRHERLCLVQGCKRDCRVALCAYAPQWVLGRR
jgi:hypothetical protein